MVDISKNRHLIFAVLLLLVSISSAQAEDRIFKEEFCDCDVGLPNTRAHAQHNMYGCTWQAEDSGSIRIEVWTMGEPQYAEEYYLRGAVNSPDSIKNKHENDKENNERSVTLDYELTDTRASYISGIKGYNSDDIWGYSGKRRGLLNDIYVYSMYSGKGDENIVKHFDDIEACITGVVEGLPGYKEGPSVKLLMEGKPLKFMGGGDALGSYAVSGEMMFIPISYTKDSKTYFSIGVEEEQIELEIKLDDGKISQIGIDDNYWSITPTAELDLAEALEKDNPLYSILLQYLHFTEALEYYLSLGVEFDKEVKIETFSEKSSHYSPKEWKIFIDIDRSLYDSEWRAFVEYHEFSHFVQHMLYGDGWITASGINHGGYSNPTTTDSFQEGFAEFMPLLIADKAGFESLDRMPSQYISMNLEDNYKAWDSIGKLEEYAIAGILWDLIDSLEEAKEGETIREDLTAGFTKALQESYDYNQDGKFGFDEMIIISYLMSYDDNTDGMIGKDEFVTFLDYCDELTKFLDSELEDKRLDKEEIAKLVDKAAVVWHKNQIFSDDYRDPTIDEIIAIEKDRDSSLYVTYIIFNNLDEKQEAKDDDEVEIEFSEIWSILSRPHKDFTSVYESLVGNFSKQKEGIDRIFIEHGFYMDTDKGNGRWDPYEAFLDRDRDGVKGNDEEAVDFPIGGFVYNDTEKVGTASNYERPERKSFEPMPGHFIKTDASVSVFVLSENPYAYTAKSVDGLAYVPVLPGTVVFTEIGDKSSVQTAVNFEANREEYAKRGYYHEHEQDSPLAWLWVVVLLLIVIPGAYFLLMKKQKKKRAKKKK